MLRSLDPLSGEASLAGYFTRCPHVSRPKLTTASGLGAEVSRPTSEAAKSGGYAYRARPRRVWGAV